MESKDLFAKVALSALIGLNVGAYYVFWPSQQGEARSEAKPAAEDKGQTHLLPAKPKEKAPPKPVVPMSIPGPAKAPEPLKLAPKPSQADDPVNKLLEHIKKEADGAKKAEPTGPQHPDSPKPLPPLQGDEIKLPAFPKDIEVPLPTDTKKVGLGPAPPPKGAESPWDVRTERIDNQTLVIAKLKQATGQPIEFRILGDKLDAKATELQVLGKVTFMGPAVNGTCQRATLVLGERRLVFEDPGRGDRVIWEGLTPNSPRSPGEGLIPPGEGPNPPRPLGEGLGVRAPAGEIPPPAPFPNR